MFVVIEIFQIEKLLSSVSLGIAMLFSCFFTNFDFVQFHYYLFCYLSGILLQPPLEEEGF